MGRGSRKKRCSSYKMETVCLPMAEGGVGVRDMADFNIAGMMKLAWRILENPSSLLARFFKHRYFRNSSIWEAEGRRGCSQAWKGILLGLFHLRGNVQWNIGNGQLVDFWMDPWLVGQPLSDLHDDNIQEFMGAAVGRRLGFCRIAHPASDSLRNIWRKVENYTLPLQPKTDLLVWIHSANGLFFIKRASEFIRHQGSSQLIFRALWSSKCHPRAKWFSWLALHNRLPTSFLLQQRDMQLDSLCPFCSNHDDNLFHLLFQCTFAQRVWRSLAWRCEKRFVLGTSVPDLLRWWLLFMFKSHGLHNIWSSIFFTAILIFMGRAQQKNF
ncbi:hypothetical protein AMTRI_Chr09g17430 [Amborella trichopoda]